MKFYAIKNDEGKWLTFGDNFKIEWSIDAYAFVDKEMADYYAEENDGNVVPLVVVADSVKTSQEVPNE
ncbi:hypothetical protein [Lacticaseibacillus sp. N501-2]|uniref:hypothetical protein n=1 Tax=Lacticaseibacillus salsurae TaxID=3367729 RepID=UPI0038B3B5E9